MKQPLTAALTKKPSAVAAAPVPDKPAKAISDDKMTTSIRIHPDKLFALKTLAHHRRDSRQHADRRGDQSVPRAAQSAEGSRLMAQRTVGPEKLLAAQEALQAAVDALANALPVPAPDEVKETQFLTIVPNMLN